MYAEIVRGERKNKDERMNKGKREVVLKESLLRATRNVYDMPRLEGLFNVKISYIGGLNGMLQFEGEKMPDDFLGKGRNTWETSFLSDGDWFDMDHDRLDKVEDEEAIEINHGYVVPEATKGQYTGTQKAC
ncbi:hypothetical protein L1887_15013 [Cichorium endivia]|nr:hypothetical protein L1887_15013 [Cichorium endivia]